MDRPLVVLEGEVFSEISLSRVNREIASALVRRGNLDLALNTPLEGPYLDVPQYAPLRARVGGALPRRPDLLVRHYWPPEFRRPTFSRYAHIQPWEYGELPISWLDGLRNVDEVWCYSRHVRDIYARAGIEGERLVLLPLGVDREVFRPEGPSVQLATRASFRILFVGGTIWRKGADLLLNAFLRAFGPGDDVCLIVKDVGAKTSYQGQNFGGGFRALVGRADAPEVHYLDETLDDVMLAALYRTVDVVVHPYRGEGFGLPMLEAMACGTPVIATDGGAADDFIDDTVGIRVASTRVPVPSSQLEPMVGEAWCLEIPVDRLAAVLRAVAGKRDALRALGGAAAQRVRDSWTWDATAAIVEARAEEARLSGSQPAIP
jgi:glycosyltransferase involved in cell wall biosynthesis